MQTTNQNHLNFLIDRIYDTVEPGQPKVINRITDTQVKEAVEDVIKETEKDYGREYDLPGDGYFIHLLNQPLIDYNILDTAVMSIVIGAVGFIIFVLLKL